jgi:hypothetical protein
MRSRIRRRSVVLLCAVLAVAVCQSTVSAERLPVRGFTQSDGLGHDRVKRMVADSRGFLWFCTPEGLSRFDGDRFVTYNQASGLPVASPNDILELPDGRYIVATNGGGVAWFDPTRGAVSGQGTAPRARPFVAQAIGADAATNRVNALVRLSDGRAGEQDGRHVCDHHHRRPPDPGAPLREPPAGDAVR